MEGLPVRQWRKTLGIVNTAPPREDSNVNNMHNSIWKELPMPQGSELYNPMSQALLRAARMGQVNRPTPPPLEDEKDPGDEEDAEGEIDTGFIAMKWIQVPKNMEEPEVEFLAKRRKGLPSVYGGSVGAAGVQNSMRKTKVRKSDAEGNAYTVEFLVPEGTVVEGEIAEEEAKAETLAPGTVVAGVGVANAEGIVIAAEPVIPTPARRRPPPPKRRPKGPGRGRKKPRSSASNAVNIIQVSANIDSSNNYNQDATLADVTMGNTTVGGASIQDVEMGDDAMLQDGEEGGEEGSDDEDDDGEDGEDDREEGELSPTPEADAPGSISKSPLKYAHVQVKAAGSQPLEQQAPVISVDPEPVNRAASSSPDLPLAIAQPLLPPVVQVIAESIPATPGIAEAPLEAPTASEHLPDAEVAEIVAQIPPPVSGLELQLPEPRLDVALNPDLDSILNPVVPPPQPFSAEVRSEPQRTHDAQQSPDVAHFSDGEEDLLGSLERHLQ